MNEDTQNVNPINPENTELNTSANTAPPVPDDTANQVAIAAQYEDDDYLRPDREIRGWLLLFLIVGVGLGTVGSIISTLMDLSDLSGIFSNTTIGLFVAYMAVYGFLGIYTIVAFFRHQPDAVTAAKVFVIVRALDGIIAAVVTDFAEPVSVIKSLGWAAIWFTFLCCSSRVQEVIPSEERKTGIIVPVAGVLALILNILSCRTVSGEIDNYTGSMIDDYETSVIANPETPAAEYTDISDYTYK